ncbi:hypothetical protein DSM112329_00928 [Paraconexibacter sp. AEG42_29]|uniref:PucR family transcriptional regulator n=1 Tax=Paraconexibacter sp. AEG42_29 TaxID=2997339 RepID=A0AAU7AR03_9ACTN
MHDGAPDRWTGLIDGVLADTDAIAADTLGAIREALPVYRDVAPEELLASLRVSFDLILRSARDRGLQLDDTALEALAAGGRHRAAAGVRADEMLLAWRIGFQIVLDHARAIGARDGIPPEQMLEFLQALIAWSDRGMVVVTAAHHDAALDSARADQETRSDFVRGALLGTLPPAELTARAAAIDLDPTHEYVAVRAAVPAGLSVTEVRRVAGFGETVGSTRGQTALIGDDVAGFLPELHSRAATIVIGAGPPRTLDKLAESFDAATRALATARAFGLTGVQRFEDLGLLPAIAADHAVGTPLRVKYVDPLNAETAQSVRVWLAAGLHVDRAAEQLFVHPNTLRYRLARFEELTGTSLKDPVTQFEAWWALQYASIDLGAGSKAVRP